MSSSAVIKPIFEIRATEDKNNISTPMLSVSGKSAPILWFSGCKRPTKNQLCWFWLVTGNIPSSSKGNNGENTVIGYKIDNGKAGVFTSSKFVELIETLGGGGGLYL